MTDATPFATTLAATTLAFGCALAALCWRREVKIVRKRINFWRDQFFGLSAQNAIAARRRHLAAKHARACQLAKKTA